MFLRRGMQENYDRFKPPGMEDHLTISELARRVGRTQDRIKQLERAGRIASPVRVKLGSLKGIRLYSPEEAAAIEEHFKNAKPGNPGKSA